MFSEETSDEPADGTVGKEKYINCFTFLSLKQPFTSVSEILIARFFLLAINEVLVTTDGFS